MSDNDPQALLFDLQTRLTYQEDALEKLDAVVSEQDRRIARLSAALERLSRQLDSAQVSGEDGAPGGAAHEEQERPPHY